MCWPWNFSDDFNELDKNTRNKLILKEGREMAKNCIMKAHPHQYQKLACDGRCKKEKPKVPLEAYDLRARLDDTFFTSLAKENLKNDLELSGERCRAIASSITLEYLLMNSAKLEYFQVVPVLEEIIKGNDQSPREILRELNARAVFINCKKPTEE